MTNKVPTVFVVDDDAGVCQSTQWLLESAHLGVETFSTAREFLDAFDSTDPGCIVLDVRLPGMSGLDLLEDLAAQGIKIPIIIVTAYGDVAMAVRALKSGAMDFLQKPYNDQTLLDVVHRAIERDASIRVQSAERTDIAHRSTRLTARERQVMALVVVGRANKQIAAELGCSGKTIEVHRSRVMEKMRADSLAGLVRMALALADGKG